ncbi:MAG: sensor histidine kinase [Flavobacteriales bacterium]|nr:sensor histidine kinase [Flavobacteriales bacterium]
MRPLTPRQVSLWAAALVAALIGLLAASSQFLLDGAVDPISTGLLAIGAFGISFGVLWYFLQRFVQDRIRAIYKAVQGGRAGSLGSPEKLRMDEDVLGEVNREMLDWASERRNEIKGLRERERFRREFIGNLAHELKTPIFNIQGYILTLLEGGLEDEKVNRDFLQRASAGVERLNKIVEDLDMITKLESGIMDLNIRRTDLHALIDEAIKSIEIRAKEKGVRVMNLVPPGKLVKADEDRLMHVFMNLFQNAINYGREGGYCRVAVEDIDDEVLVEVSDDGIGIGPEHLPRLFERFYRVGSSRSRNEGGSGLGLAIVKHIIDAHGSTITVKSEEGAGTTFVFNLKRSR